MSGSSLPTDPQFAAGASIDASVITAAPQLGSPEYHPDPAFPERVSSVAVESVELESVAENEVACLTEALSTKFEELSLIYELTESLQIETNIESCCRPLVEHIFGCVGAELVMIELDPDQPTEFNGLRVWSGSMEKDLSPSKFEAECQCQSMEQPVPESLDRVIQSVRRILEKNGDPTHATILNSQTSEIEFRLIGIEIQRNGHSLGRFFALRQLDQPEFGTVEGDLIRSTSMLLGAHLQNQRQYHQIRIMFDGMIQSLVSALDAKDAYTSGHSNRVADLAVELSKHLEYDEEDLRRIHRAGMLHDIGKIGVEDSVLRKAGRLTDEEFEQIKLHPVLGYEILKEIPPFESILPAVRHHHESVDGSGYPDGLVGDEIPRDAQIIAVADAFDAMTSDRPYRTGMQLETVLKIFREGREKQWKGDVVDVLLSHPNLIYQYALKDPSATNDDDSLN